jgi:hypothetical protein
MNRSHFSLNTRGSIVRSFLSAIAVIAVLIMIPGSAIGSGVPANRTLDARGEGSATSLAITVHSCPDDFNGTGFFQFETTCTSETGLYGVPLQFTYPNGSVSFLYSQPDGAGGAQPMLVTQIGAGTMLIGEVSSSRVKESVVFCSQSRAGNGGPVMDGDQVGVSNGIAAITFQEGDTAGCDWYRFPGNATTTAGSVISTSVSITVHSCPDDFGATGFYQYGVNCNSETGLYGVPLKFTLPDGMATFQYSQPSGSGTALPMQLTGLGSGSLSVTEVYSGRIHESVVFCSQSDANGLPILDGDEVPVTNGTATLTLSEGDDANCDWYRYPGGIAMNGDSGSPTATPTGAAISIEKWVCDDQPAEYYDSILPEDQLDDLKQQCELASDPFEFTLDHDDPVKANEHNGFTVLWPGLSAGHHEIVETEADGYEGGVVICEGQIPGVTYIRPNMFAFEVNHGGFGYDLSEHETLDCIWFNNASDSHHGNSNSGQSGNGSDDLTPDATVEHNGNDVFLTNDSDDDGLLDDDEINMYGTDPKNEDTDGDGIGDGDEVTFGTDPLMRDTDIDGISDGDEEYVVGTDPTQNDTDFDGFGDGDELNNYSTNPLNPDTDGDGVSDGDEILQGTDPLNP